MATSSTNATQKFNIPKGLKIVVKFGNITNEKANAIVVPEGNAFKELGMVGDALDKVHPKFKRKRDSLISKIDLHNAQWKAFSSKLGGPFEHVLHAVLRPVDKCDSAEDWRQSMDELYNNVLQKAEEKKIKCLVMPLLGSGKGRANAEDAINVALDVIIQFKPKNLKWIIMVNQQKEIFDVIINQCKIRFPSEKTESPLKPISGVAAHANGKPKELTSSSVKGGLVVGGTKKPCQPRPLPSLTKTKKGSPQQRKSSLLTNDGKPTVTDTQHQPRTHKFPVVNRKSWPPEQQPGSRVSASPQPEGAVGGAVDDDTKETDNTNRGKDFSGNDRQDSKKNSGQNGKGQAFQHGIGQQTQSQIKKTMNDISKGTDSESNENTDRSTESTDESQNLRDAQSIDLDRKTQGKSMSIESEVACKTEGSSKTEQSAENRASGSENIRDMKKDTEKQGEHVTTTSVRHNDKNISQSGVQNKNSEKLHCEENDKDVCYRQESPSETKAPESDQNRSKAYQKDQTRKNQKQKDGKEPVHDKNYQIRAEGDRKDGHGAKAEQKDSNVSKDEQNDAYESEADEEEVTENKAEAKTGSKRDLNGKSGSKTDPENIRGSKTDRKDKPGSKTDHKLGSKPDQNDKPGSKTVQSDKPGFQTVPTDEPGSKTDQLDKPGSKREKPGSKTDPTHKPGSMTDPKEEFHERSTANLNGKNDSKPSQKIKDGSNRHVCSQNGFGGQNEAAFIRECSTCDQKDVSIDQKKGKFEGDNSSSQHGQGTPKDQYEENADFEKLHNNQNETQRQKVEKNGAIPKKPTRNDSNQVEGNTDMLKKTNKERANGHSLYTSQDQRTKGVSSKAGSPRNSDSGVTLKDTKDKRDKTNKSGKNLDKSSTYSVQSQKTDQKQKSTLDKSHKHRELPTPGKGQPQMDTVKDSNDSNGDDQQCPICMGPIEEPKTLDKCGHVFCRECIDQSFKQYKPVCPNCNTVYGELTGNQPEGQIQVNYTSESLPGYKQCGTIEITYHFADGLQGQNHPHPGMKYTGTTRWAYLPNCKEGKEVLELLKIAFNRKLTFTIGRSTTTGKENVVTWNDIHHKTNKSGGSSRFGYPDDTYLDRVRDELKSKGVE